MNRRQLDEAYPTLLRYTGWAVTLVLVTVTIVLSFSGNATAAATLSPGYVAAAGMILYKTVRDAARPPDDDAHDDRWSGLP